MKMPRLNQTHIRFGLVGIVNTGIDFGIYSTLVIAGLAPFFANIISTSAGMIVSFFLNRNFTFQSSASNHKRQIALFLIFTLTGLWLLQPAVIYSFRAVYTHLFGITGHATELALIGKVLATVASLCWNYFWYSRHVFSNRDVHETP